jgi:hypothetical protein
MAKTPTKLPALWPFNVLCGPALLGLIIVLATLATDSSYASYTSVRLAPSVSLSSGAELVLETTVDDMASDVRHAAYVIYVPRGVTVTGTGFDNHGSVEAIQARADLPANAYSMSVTVETGSAAVAMTAVLYIRGGQCSGTSLTLIGTSGKPMIVRLHC